MSRLSQVEDIINKKGIYEHKFTGDHHLLSIRTFSAGMKETKYDEQGGICLKCGGEFDLTEMEGNRIDPWSEGG